MRVATETKEARDKHPVMPDNVLSSRELLGELLLELNQPAAAQAEFERPLKLTRTASAAFIAPLALPKRLATARRCRCITSSCKCLLRNMAPIGSNWLGLQCRWLL